MRTWTRAAADVLCGRCGVVLHRGEPLLEIQIAGLTRPRRRCGACAGGPVPVDLPPLVERMAAPPQRVPIRAGAIALPFDFKMAQAGREPGEDDE